MTIKIELPPEIEADLAARAAAQGMALSSYLQQLLEERARALKSPSLPPEERARQWRESAAGIPYTPPLSDQSVSRESFYGPMAR